jgi:DNA (cytosine-5)-methyltransferase 1
VYKGDGATGGDTTFAIVGDHENRPTDMTNPIISLDRASFNQGVNAKFDIGIDESGVAHTIVAKGPNAVCYAIEGNGSRESQHGCGYTEGDKSYTLNTTEVHGVCYAVDMGGYKSKVGITEDVSPTLTTTHYGEPAVCVPKAFQPLPYTLKIRGGVSVDSSGKQAGKGALVQVDKSATLGCNQDQYLFQPIGLGIQSSQGIDKMAVDVMPCLINGSNPGWQNGVMIPKLVQPIGVDPYNGCLTDDKSSTLGVNCGMTTGRQAVVFGVDAYNQTITGDKAKSLTCKADSDHIPFTCYSNRIRYIVRRLTPLECERLQGFPDGWTDIGEYTDTKGKKRKTSDASRYKALGNSIALPSWKWVLKRISAQYERDASMVSLFDGIGGFPLLWEQINGKGSCLWASEVDDFPIAVTKERFK